MAQPRTIGRMDEHAIYDTSVHACRSKLGRSRSEVVCLASHHWGISGVFILLASRMLTCPLLLALAKLAALRDACGLSRCFEPEAQRETTFWLA